MPERLSLAIYCCAFNKVHSKAHLPLRILILLKQTGTAENITLESVSKVRVTRKKSYSPLDLTINNKQKIAIYHVMKVASSITVRQNN